MKIEGGVVKALMTEFKVASQSGGVISAAEVQRIMRQGIQAMRDDYDGATSEKGLAAERNALAKTFRAADKNWKITSAGYRAAREILGTNLDGKGGEVALAEMKIRQAVHGPSHQYHTVGGY